MEHWQKCEKHHREIKEILTRLGCLDSNGQLRKWDGPKIVPEMEKLGHSSVAFEVNGNPHCKCATS